MIRYLRIAWFIRQHEAQLLNELLMAKDIRGHAAAYSPILVRLQGLFGLMVVVARGASDPKIITPDEREEALERLHTLRRARADCLSRTGCASLDEVARKFGELTAELIALRVRDYRSDRADMVAEPDEGQ